MTVLKVLRIEKVLSQRDLASLSGVSVATINRLENGLQRPTFKTIRKLAKALNIKPEELEF